MVTALSSVVIIGELVCTPLSISSPELITHIIGTGSNCRQL